MIGNTRQYSAFISYTNYGESDRRWAEWVYQSLTKYVIPKHLRSEWQPKSTVGQIFFDPESSQVGRPGNAILAAVQASRFLIVICSPRAKMSKWVEEEICQFIGLHGPLNVIPILLEGSPETSYPAGLFAVSATNQPLRIDLTLARGWRAPIHRERALIKILACLLACDIDELQDRHWRSRRARARSVLILACALGFTTAAAVWATLRAHRDAQGLSAALGVANTAASEARRKAKIFRILADGYILSTLEREGNVLLNDRGAWSPKRSIAWVEEFDSIFERSKDWPVVLLNLDMQGVDNDADYSGLGRDRFKVMLQDQQKRVLMMNAASGLRDQIDKLRPGR